MTPEQLVDVIRREYGQMITLMPQEKENSLGVVYREFEPKHAKMALWLRKHHGMQITTHNLHFIIHNWHLALRDAKLTKKGHVVISFVDTSLSDPESQSDVNPLYMKDYMLKEYLK